MLDILKKRILMLNNRLSETAATMCAVIVVLFFVISAFGTAVSLFIHRFEGPGAFVAGCFIGCAVSAAKVVLLERTLSRAVDMGPRAKGYAALHSVARYLATAVALAPAVVFPQIVGLIGVIAGILTLQVSAYVTSRVIRKRM